MSKQIRAGDEVIVVWHDTDGGESTMEATVISSPQGAGDSWQVETAWGDVWLINVYASHFEAMIKRSHKRKAEEDIIAQLKAQRERNTDPVGCQMYEEDTE